MGGDTFKDLSRFKEDLASTFVIFAFLTYSAPAEEVHV